MNTSKSTSNGYLTALWAIGTVMMFIGGVMWLANSSESRYGDESSLVAQTVGGGLIGAGVSFIALGLAAAAICHQIRQSD